MSTSLWPHQAAAVDKLAPVGRGALFLDMGTGKTRTALELVARWGCRRVLILCPLKVVRVWPQEFAKHVSPDWQVAALDTGTIPRRCEALRTGYLCAACDDAPFAAALNYDALVHRPLPETLAALEWDCLICDESHRLKQHDGKQSVLAAQIARQIPHRLLLTGTPMPHSPLDIFAQARLLDERLFGSNWYHFQATYAEMTTREVWFKPKPRPGQPRPQAQKRQIRAIATDREGRPIYRNIDRLQSILEPLAVRVTDEVLDLPDAVDERVYCLLSPQTQRAYHAMAEELVADLGSGLVTASNALTRILRLAQIANGHAPDTGTGETVRLGTEKADLLADVLSDLPDDEPVVVFGRFHADLDATAEVAAAAGRGYHEVSGRRNELQIWQGGAGNVLGVQLQAGGVGVDFTRARYQVYFSLDHNLGNYLQTRKRIHRPGQTRNVTYIHLLAAGTVDEDIMAALEQRRDVVTAVVDGLRKGVGAEATLGR